MRDYKAKRSKWVKRMLQKSRKWQGKRWRKKSTWIRVLEESWYEEKEEGGEKGEGEGKRGRGGTSEECLRRYCSNSFSTGANNVLKENCNQNLNPAKKITAEMAALLSAPVGEIRLNMQITRRSAGGRSLPSPVAEIASEIYPLIFFLGGSLVFRVYFWNELHLPIRWIKFFLQRLFGITAKLWLIWWKWRIQVSDHMLIPTKKGVTDDNGTNIPLSSTRPSIFTVSFKNTIFFLSFCSHICAHRSRYSSVNQATLSEGSPPLPIMFWFPQISSVLLQRLKRWICLAEQNFVEFKFI